jgi:hypothetical protein
MNSDAVDQVDVTSQDMQGNIMNTTDTDHDPAAIPFPPMPAAPPQDVGRVEENDLESPKNPWFEPRCHVLDVTTKYLNVDPVEALAAWVGYLQQRYKEAMDAVLDISGWRPEYRLERLRALMELEVLAAEIDWCRDELDLLVRDRAGAL